jgi:hypothetical protein
MKTYKNLYPKIYEFENLYRAYRAARRAKRAQVSVASFEFDWEHNLLELQTELREQTYRPGAYDNFYIYEPKRRLVSAAPFRDRVARSDHALCNVIEPIWEARFIASSFACRVGKGTHQAMDQCQTWTRRYRYALQGDIVKYFPSVDHQILRELLAHHIADARTLTLMDLILTSGADIQSAECPRVYFPSDDLFAALRPRGLPIGNLTSQFWANHPQVPQGAAVFAGGAVGQNGARFLRSDSGRGDRARHPSRKIGCRRSRLGHALNQR